MKNVIITIILAIIHASSFTQTVQKLSLQEAIDLGLKNRYDLQASRHNADISRNAVQKSKNEWLPEINASGDIRYNTQLQSTIIPAGFGGSSKPQSFELGSKNNSSFGLDINQYIFKPAINTDIKLAQSETALEKEKIREEEIKIKTQISQAYLNVLLKDLQWKITQNNEQRHREYLDLFQGKYNKGALLENDLLKVKLDYENSKVQREQDEQQYELAMVTLKHAINVPTETRLALTDVLNDSQITKEVNETPIDKRPEIRQLLISRQQNQLQVSKIYKSKLPTVSLYANYSVQYLNENFDYSNGTMWSPFNFLGIKLSIPISSHYKDRANITGYHLQEAQTALQIQQKVTDLNYELTKSRTDLQNAMQNMRRTRSNYDLSKAIYQNQKQQYSLGAFQYSNLIDTEKSLNTAEQNYVRSVYDYLVARINYQQAAGSL